ncbi:MAG TPA: glycosyltransferase 87 family protein [Actinomycetota bacterium]|nr:glycosyltransferase 87 family protein [Actinomycetota bacterium]
MKHARRTVGLGVVLACVVGTMAIGTALKSPCARGDWSDLRQYRLLCYSDIVPLLGTEQLRGGRLPFLDPCEEIEGQNCDEYPVVTMYAMRAAAWIAGEEYGPFFYANAVILTAAAAAVATGVWLLAGRRALWFALAPTLLVYGTVNWDLIAVAFATIALVAFAARRDGWAGVLLGLGAAAKLYPALLVVPLLAQRLQDREPDRGIRLAWAAAASWVAVNLPFMIAAPGSWWEFFRFNGARPADWDSGWFIACRTVGVTCDTGTINAVSAVLFLATFAALWVWKLTRSPSFPRWTLILPLLVCFLLTNKVYSPQYGLWLLPVFALVLPDLKPFVAFAVADVAVFVTRFWFFEELSGGSGTPQWLFEVAVVSRAVVLLWCVAAWLVRDADPLVLGRRGWRPADAAAQPA